YKRGWHALAEVEQHRGLQGRREGPAGLQLGNLRPHLRYLSRTQAEAARGNRLHARSTDAEAEALRDPEGRARAAQAGPHGRLDVPAERLRQVGRIDRSLGEALRGALRAGGGRELVLGALERAEHCLLEGDAGRVQPALRSYGRGAEACLAQG